jgi:hypothetical protein
VSANNRAGSWFDANLPGTPQLAGGEQDFVILLVRNQLDTSMLLPPTVPGGYDWNHVAQMATLYDQFVIKYPHLGVVSRLKYMVAVILHNTDRPASSIQAGFHWSKPEGRQKWEVYLRDQLRSYPCPGDVDEIVLAILDHPKRDDAHDDSLLLQMLRVADKIVRFGALGMIGQAANRGRTAMFYNPMNPFQYAEPDADLASIEQGMNVLVDYFRVLEWVKMITYLRDMIPWDSVAETVLIVRMVGAEIAKVTGCNDNIEACLKKALGEHYARFPKIA